MDMTQAVPTDIASDTDLLAAKLVPLRRPGRWLTAAVVLVLLAMLVHTVLTNPRFQWDVVGRYFTTAAVLHGLWLTIWLTAAVMVCGYVLGTGLAVLRLSGNPILRSVSFGYVWLVRSVPPLVQLLFWYELASEAELDSLTHSLDIGAENVPLTVTLHSSDIASQQHLIKYGQEYPAEKPKSY